MYSELPPRISKHKSTNIFLMPEFPLLQLQSSTSSFICLRPGNTSFLFAVFSSAFQDWDLPSILSPLKDTDVAPQSLLIHLTVHSSEQVHFVLLSTAPVTPAKTSPEQCVKTTSNILNAMHLLTYCNICHFCFRGKEQKYDVHDFPDRAKLLLQCGSNILFRNIFVTYFPISVKIPSKISAH